MAHMPLGYTTHGGLSDHLFFPKKCEHSAVDEIWENLIIISIYSKDIRKLWIGPGFRLNIMGKTSKIRHDIGMPFEGPCFNSETHIVKPLKGKLDEIWTSENTRECCLNSSQSWAVAWKLEVASVRRFKLSSVKDEEGPFHLRMVMRILWKRSSLEGCYYKFSRAKLLISIP